MLTTDKIQNVHLKYHINTNTTNPKDTDAELMK